MHCVQAPMHSANPLMAELLLNTRISKTLKCTGKEHRDVKKQNSHCNRRNQRDRPGDCPEVSGKPVTLFSREGRPVRREGSGSAAPYFYREEDHAFSQFRCVPAVRPAPRRRNLRIFRIFCTGVHFRHVCVNFPHGFLVFPPDFPEKLWISPGNPSILNSGMTQSKTKDVHDGFSG